VTSAPPVLNRRILQTLVKAELDRLPSSPGGREGRPGVQARLVLVHGRYADPASANFTVIVDGVKRQVRVSDQHSVLGAVEAWQQHLSASPDGDDLLVITTSVGDDLGWDLRGVALRARVLSVDRVEIVQQRFRALDVDPRIRQAPWLVDALIDAEPALGWPAQGGVLTLDAAVRALVGVRLGLTEETQTGGLDADALLAWTQRPGAPEQFARLPEAEREGIAGWLSEQAGKVAAVLLALSVAGRAQDALALGVISAVATMPGASAEAALALGGLLGGAVSRPGELRALGEVVEGTLARWVADAERRGPHSEPARRVLGVARRADELAAQAGLTETLSSSRVLPSSLRARMRTLALSLAAPADGTLDPARVAAAQAALEAVQEHSLARLDSRALDVARMSVRLLRWLGEQPEAVASVAAGVSRHVADWGWVDRALAVVWTGDPLGDEVVGHAYRRLHDAVRARRDGLDEQFAARLVTWAAQAASAGSGGCLLVEDVLAKVVAPLVDAGPAPLIIVVDGMSSAVAAELGVQLQDRAWTEISRHPDQRQAAVSVLPSITRLSRASLLSGKLTEGDQAVESTGFSAFWRARRRDAALFHKADLAGPAGHRLAEPLVQALSGETVVGVVLNTIDDALDHGREGDRTGWRLQDITYLPELLDAARGYGRPVVIVADHGHVLDRSRPGDGPTSAPGVESARWRTGAPEAGEVEVAGPRVLAGGGRVVLPWREDIHYTPRKAGYHGGASLAEVTVPLLVVVGDLDGIPSGWSALAPGAGTPGWWENSPTAEATYTGVGVSVPLAGPVTSAGRPRKASRAPQEDSLFDVPGADVPTEASTATSVAQPPRETSLGMQVVDGEVYAVQKSFVRKPPDKVEVAAVIDALAAASGTLPLVTVAARAGRAGRNPQFFAATLERLLNVEGYEVVRVIDDGRTLRLDIGLLREQFGVAR
jgi:hypothetical protein